MLIGALTLHGVQPGPLLFERHPEIPFSIFIAMAVTMPFMVALGLGGVRFWVLVTQVPKSLVATLVGAMCLLGSYASMNDTFAIYVTVFFGVVGYGLNKIDIYPAPIVLALVLGYLTESNLRRAMSSSGGDWTVFFSHPTSVFCLGAALITLILPIIRRQSRPQTV